MGISSKQIILTRDQSTLLLQAIGEAEAAALFAASTDLRPTLAYKELREDISAQLEKRKPAVDDLADYWEWKGES